jgi:hypothetical protein
MRVKLVVASLIIVFCSLIGAKLLIPAGASASNAGNSDEHSSNASNHATTDHPALGIPAIKPTLANGSQRFTIADVKAYLKTHPFPSGPTTTGKDARILTIAFMTSKEASIRMHGESVGLADTDQVCYVELYGPFTMTRASVPPGASLPVSNTGVEVFDALTGNLLLWWVPS